MAAPFDPSIQDGDYGSGGDVVFEGGGASGSIANITSANPGVVTVDAAVTAGQTIYVYGVGGMAEVNDANWKVGTVTDHGDGTYSFNLQDTSAVDVDTSGFDAYTSGGSFITPSSNGAIAGNGIATATNNLFDDGAVNTISWSPVTGAQRYRVYKLENGLYGYIGETPETTFADDNIAPDLSATPPLDANPFGSAGDYPGAAAYFEQRRCFAATENEPAYFWATRSGTEANLSYSLPGRDDDSVRFRIAARERSEIRHIVPLGQLVLLSENMEWRVSPAGGGALTPDVSIRPQSGVGSSHVPPAIVNNNIVFAASRGGHVREMAYSEGANGYVTGDICMRATHLFDAFDVVDMAYQKTPVPIVWCVSSNGDLLGITYVPDQQVGAWHRHDTQGGSFEAVAVVPEDGRDVLYATIARETASGTERFVERMEPHLPSDTIEQAFFADAAVEYSGAATTTISGLAHLEGETVVALADGAVVDGLTVASGEVELPTAASRVVVGLPITMDLKTPPAAFEVGGLGQGRPKNLNRLWLRVYNSRDVRAGPAFDKLREYSPRTDENYDSAPGLLTGEVDVVLTPRWSEDGQLCVRHDTPLPFTLLSITPEHEIAG